MKKPNVLIVMCDQFRGDCLSFDGHPDVKTPYLDTLAADSTFFAHAYSACPSCIPARVTLFTGKKPSSHGRVGYQDGVAWEYPHMMAEEFVEHGYQSACIGKMHVHPPRLQCGFQSIKLHDGYIGHYRKATLPHWMHQHVSDDYMRYLKDKLGEFADVNSSGVENNSWISHPWIYEEHLHPTNWTIDESIRFLETRDRSKPFFLMTSFVRPHPPFDTPQSYFDLYMGKKLREPAHGDWVDTSLCEKDGMILDSVHGCRDDQLKHEAMAGYYACITHVDHQFGRLITALENDETYANTVIVFTSDHGELLFDNHLFRKVLPYEGSTRIPLILHVGKDIRKCLPHTSDSVVELMDIMPTLLDICDIDIPKDVDGCSLKQEVFQQDKIVRKYIHGEHSRDYEQSNQYIVTKKDKYIWFTQSNIEQYFNLAQDPREEHNLINDPMSQPRIDTLRGFLIKELTNREEGYIKDGKLVANRPPLTLLKHPFHKN